MVAFQLLMHVASAPQRLAQRLRTTSFMAVSRTFGSSAAGATFTSLPGLPTLHGPVPVVQFRPSVSSSMMVFHHLSVAVLNWPSTKVLSFGSILFQVARLTMVNDMVKPTGRA